MFLFFLVLPMVVVGFGLVVCKGEKALCKGEMLFVKGFLGRLARFPKALCKGISLLKRLLVKGLPY